MSEQPSKSPIITLAVMRELKTQGIISRATLNTQLALSCAACPLAKDEPFHQGRARRCANLPLQALHETTIDLGRSHALVILRGYQRPNPNAPRVVYSVNPIITEILGDPQNVPGLPGCQKLAKNNP